MISPDAILQAIESLPPIQSTAERDYLGASSIGDPCARKLWLQFHKYIEPEQFSKRILRLFYRGQREEGFFEMYLRDTGFEIVEDCFSQARWTEGFFSGAGDGVVIKDGVRYVCEYKTASDSAFKQLKRGQLETIKPLHYAQMQINGAKFDCEYAIYLAVNKNNDELFCDVVAIDPEKVKEIKAKAEYITSSDKPPERISSKPTSYLCKDCHAKDVCFGFELPRVNCRNCTSVEKHQRYGSFGCHKVKQSDRNNQLDERGWCEDHSFNPYAMNDLYGWSPLEFFPKQRAVQYDNGIINGAAPFGVPSKELKLD